MFMLIYRGQYLHPIYIIEVNSLLYFHSHYVAFAGPMNSCKICVALFFSLFFVTCPALTLCEVEEIIHKAAY